MDRYTEIRNQRDFREIEGSGELNDKVEGSPITIIGPIWVSIISNRKLPPLFQSIIEQEVRPIVIIVRGGARYWE